MNYEYNQCIAGRLNRISNKVNKMIRKDLAPYNITEKQISILFVLYKLGRIDQGIIGKKLMLERSTVSRSVRLLESQLYIKRSGDYRPEIYLTKLGGKKVEELTPIWNSFMTNVSEILATDGMANLDQLEAKLLK